MFQILAPHATPAAKKAALKKDAACAFKLTCVTSVGTAIDSIGQGYLFVNLSGLLRLYLCSYANDSCYFMPVRLGLRQSRILPLSLHL
jgi:hypothetical protein